MEEMERVVNFNEFKLVSQIYGDTIAKRSGVPYMNHIIEGCQILLSLNCSDIIIKAYCLHPLFQVNKYQTRFLELNGYAYSDKKAISLAIMYANSANGFLCRPWTDDWDISTIEKETQFLDMKKESPKEYKEVLWMLLADKIQNQKDFMTYHFASHERSLELGYYFMNWITYLMKELNVSYNDYENAKNNINSPEMYYNTNVTLKLIPICDRLSKINDICEEYMSDSLAIIDVKNELMEAFYSAKRMDIKLWENKSSFSQSEFDNYCEKAAQLGWYVDQTEVERLLESLAKGWNLEFNEEEYHRILNESQEDE